MIYLLQSRVSGFGFRLYLYGIFTASLLLSGYSVNAGITYPFQDTALPVSIRVNDLISRLTLFEKISQLGYNVPAIERLGIPAYSYWNEALHGIAVSGLATSFPQAIALSSTWDRQLIYEVASAISDEARVKNNMEGKGLTYWSPTINMSRDPRWGRSEETYGEDPYLTAEIALNFISGMQGAHPKYLKTVATVKHFACNNVDLGRNKISSEVDERSLREYYLPAFKSCVTKGKVFSVMSAYNALNGVPCPANRTLLVNILREEWGFTGYVVSDCDAVADVWYNHQYVATEQDATALCLKSGTDLNCGGTYQNYSAAAIYNGLMSETDIDTALTRVFKARFLLGEFDPPSMVPYTSIPNEELDCEEHRNLALQAAREAIVLLKNRNSLLPLNKNALSRIALIGPNANVVQLGGYSGSPSVRITPLEGIRSMVDTSVTKVDYVRGCDMKGPENQASFDSAVALASISDVAIMVCGTDLSVATEELDRTTLDLPGVQELLIREVFRANPNTILVLVSGSSLSVTGINDSIPAILAAWYDGQAQGAAIAEILFGDYNPGGKLTSTWYKSAGDLPPMDKYDVKENRTYMYFTGEPLYPFGFGLSYTHFEYSDLVISSGSVGPGDSIRISANVKNTGDRSGNEVAQFYIHHVSPALPRPIKELKDFRRIYLRPGETQQVSFTLKHKDLAFYDDLLRTYTVADGSVSLLIGSSSEDIRLTGSVVATGSVISTTYRQDPFTKFEAEQFEKKSKSVSVEGCDEGGQNIRFSQDNEYLVYRNMDFGTCVTQLKARISPGPGGNSGDIIEVRIDSAGGILAGSLLIDTVAGQKSYHTASCVVDNIQGLHDLFLVFRTPGNSFCKLNWFSFHNTTSAPTGFNYGFYLYPNPATTQFSLAYSLPVAAEVSLEIYSMDGLMVKQMQRLTQPEGNNRLYCNISELGIKPGIYIV
ncbi:MAG: glycoside hydrolase family 3 C-terminal domain-containing protein, partial [Bacteroidota bacterium]